MVKELTLEKIKNADEVSVHFGNGRDKRFYRKNGCLYDDYGIPYKDEEILRRYKDCSRTHLIERMPNRRENKEFNLLWIIC